MTREDGPDRASADQPEDEPVDVPDEDDSAKTSADTDTGDEPEAESPRRGRGVSVLTALLVGILGFAIAVQTTRTDTSDLDSARTEDLARILADLDAQRTRLTAEIAQLETDRDELASGSEGQDAALERARELADSVGILAGTLPATGPGLVLTFEAGDEPIRAAVILDAVQELRGAGAEAMSITGGNGRTVRIVASTYFGESGGNLLVDGVTLTASQRLTVIGDPDTMSTALEIPGGVADTVQKDGGTVMVREPGTVDITTVVEPSDPEYAEPVN
ncbi:DUF881 domain-containing protein [Stackebrandtia soli]|uniref:DUF881 domain-containing protein n=1 Tax=Stackebrandtia soli TaxID=1892856 RepID=UPI0039EBEBE0